jgi:predicted RNA methylase
MSLQSCACGQVFVHVPLPGKALDSVCLACAWFGMDVCDSGNGAGTFAASAIATSAEAELGLNIENPAAAATATGQTLSKDMPTMATKSETRKRRVRTAARSIPIGSEAP